jgi:phage replication-related protein YjqB (UPF0714/DUF867 family)
MTFRATWNRRQFLATCAVLPAIRCSDQGENQFEQAARFRATSVVDVQPPAQGQIFGSSYLCSIATEFAQWMGVAPGDQVRIKRNADEYALYTIKELRKEGNPTTVRMRQSARERLGTDQGFVGQFDTQVVAEGLSDGDAREQSEFVERLVDDGAHTGLLVAAAHGGMIEINTDLQAQHLASLMPGTSSWICKGWRDPDKAYTRWHVSSMHLSPNSFAGLGAIAHRGFRHVVSFHGMSEAGVIIGGRVPLGLREHLREVIADAIADPNVPVVVAADNGPHRGIDPENFVNWLTADGEGGIQIEQSTLVRDLYWAEIAEAVCSVVEPLVSDLI